MNRVPGGALTPQLSTGALGPYARAIRAHRRLVVLVTLLAMAASVAYLSIRTPAYEASAQLLVTPLSQEDETFLGLTLIRDSGDPTRTVQTAATLVHSSQAAEATAEALGAGWSREKVLKDIEVKPEGQSNILAVSAKGADASETAELANTFAESALSTRADILRTQAAAALTRLQARQRALADSAEPTTAQELAAQITRLESVQSGDDPTLALSQEAAVPESPAGPPEFVVVLLAALGGFTLASGGALLMELLGRRIRDSDEAVQLYPLPILTRVPQLKGRNRWLARRSGWQLPPVIREAFRTLIVQLERSSPATGRVIMITSAHSGDGKTTTAVNLAVSLAAADHSVVLLDFDLRKPDVGLALGIEDSNPLADVLTSEGDLSKLVSPVSYVPSLSVLSTTATYGDVALVELLYRQLPELIAGARKLADFVIIDTAPLGEVSDALRIIDEVDQTLVVARPGHTTRVQFEQMRELLERAGHTPTGLIMVAVDEATSGSYYGYGLNERSFFEERAQRPPKALPRRPD